MAAHFKTSVPGPFTGRSGTECSVVQTLLKRELGFPIFSKSADLMSNGLTEKAVGRQLLYSRIARTPPDRFNVEEAKLEETLKTPIESVTVSAVPQKWFTIKVEKRAQVRYIEGLFWKSTTADTRGGMKTYSNTFFKLEPDHRIGFKAFNGHTAQGKLTEFEVISARALTTVYNQLPTYLIVLREHGSVNITNLSSINQLKNTTTLSLRQGSEDRDLRFTDMSLDYERQQMFALASYRGYAKRLYIVQYPSWQIQTIVHIDIPLKIQLWSSILMTCDSIGIEVLGVSDLIDITEKVKLPELSSRFTDGYGNADVRVLKRKPTLGIKIPTEKAFFGLIDTTWPPLYYIKTKTGVKVHTFQESTPIWEHELGPYNCYLFQIMPDNSNCLLFTNNDDQFMITWRKKTDDPPTYVVDRRLAFQLGLPETSPIVSSIGRSRPQLQRACKISSKKVSNQPTTRIIAMDYFDQLDLVAICAIFEGKIVVSVYEALSFKFFRSLPALQIVDNRNSSDSEDSCSSANQSISKIDKISTVDLQFDQEIMFMHIHYDQNSEVEMFGMRLLQENAPEQL